LNFDQYTVLYFSSSPHNVRSIPGHGFLITRNPFVSAETSFPVSSTTKVQTPGIGQNSKTVTIQGIMPLKIVMAIFGFLEELMTY